MSMALTFRLDILLFVILPMVLGTAVFHTCIRSTITKVSCDCFEWNCTERNSYQVPLP